VTVDTDAATAATMQSFLDQMQSSGRAVFALGYPNQRAVVDAIPTGAPSLDVALGVGGLPRGRVVELYGLESSGKTSLALSTIAQAQKLGMPAAFVDAEHALSASHATAYGVDLNQLAFYQPDHGEDALEMTREMARSGAFPIIVIDSVAALIPRAELEGSVEDLQVGAQARMMSKGLRMLSGEARRTDTTIVFINQIRQQIGVRMGNPNVTPGGKALKFFSSVRLEVFSAAGDRIYPGGKKTEPPVGQDIRVKVVKNKVAPPMRRAEFRIYYNSGVDVGSSVLEAGKELGLLVQRGASVSEVATDQRLAVGKDNFAKLLADDPQLCDRLVEQIHATLRGDVSGLAEEALPTDDEVPAAPDGADVDDEELAVG